MHTTDPITSTVPARPTLGDMVAEIGPLVGAIYVAGPPVLVAWVGTVLFALMLAGPFVLIVTLVVALAAAAAVVALAGTILATPYLLIRYLSGSVFARPRYWGSDWGLRRMRVPRSWAILDVVNNRKERHEDRDHRWERAGGQQRRPPAGSPGA